MNEKALELLRSSVKRFNDWKSYQVDPVELVGAPLAGLRLHRAELSNVDLKGADLRGTDLSGANLQSAVLYQAQAQGAILTRCRMDEAYAAEADLAEADLSQVRATNANFSRASLQRACLDHARLLDVRFEGANLDDASLFSALLVRTPLPSRRVNLKEAVVETGSRTPSLPSVDFQWISEDGRMFAIGQWTPRPDLADDRIPTFVLKLRKMARNDAEVIKHFARVLAGLTRAHHRLSACDTVACVPRSNPEATEADPVRSVAEGVVGATGLRDGTGWLIRHKAVLQSGLLSLFADEGKHLDSIKVAHSDLVQGRTILLVDDFVATGCSFRACRHLLLAAGAREVFCLAIARRISGEG